MLNFPTLSSVIKNKILLLLFSLTLFACGPSILLGGAQATHQGWTQAQALGGRTPVPQALGLAATSSSVTLSWNTMTVVNGDIDSYNIYRSTTAGGENFANPLATGILASALAYTDTTVVPQGVYYYIVRPVIKGVEFVTNSSDTEIKILVPPVNMSLVHRWIANWEMCTHLLGRSSDRNNNYRCPYVGPINQGGYYDYGHNQWWDTVEVGCNYTPPDGTTAICNDAVNGCLGTAAPGAVGSDGQVFYNRNSGICYVKTAGVWTALNAITVPGSAALFAQALSNLPGLPPASTVNVVRSSYACAQFSVPGLGTKRLPKHSEQVVAGAWNPALSDSQIALLEKGSATQSSCNSNFGNGNTFDNLTTPLPADIETLPYTQTAATYALRTGSTTTSACVSMHGIQDLISNEWEFSSDQVNTCDGLSCYVSGPSTIDPTNTDWYWNNGLLPILFDGQISVGNVAIPSTNFSFSALSNSATEFLPPLGLPMIASAHAAYDSLAIGTSSGQFNPSQFHGNKYWLKNSLTGTGYRLVSGGDYVNGANSGRFSFQLISPSVSGSSTTGFRCMLNAD